MRPTINKEGRSVHLRAEEPAMLANHARQTPWKVKPRLTFSPKEHGVSDAGACVRAPAGQALLGQSRPPQAPKSGLGLPVTILCAGKRESKTGGRAAKGRSQHPQIPDDSATACACRAARVRRALRSRASHALAPRRLRVWRGVTAEQMERGRHSAAPAPARPIPRGARNHERAGCRDCINSGCKVYH